MRVPGAQNRHVLNFGPPLHELCPFPEGIDAAPDGRIFVASMAMRPAAPICWLTPMGELEGTLSVNAGASGIAALGGMLFLNDTTLFVTDFAGAPTRQGRVLRVNPRSGDVETLVSGLAAPNGLALWNESLLVADSYEGTITLLSVDGDAHVLVNSDVLRSTGSLPVGVNGVAVDASRGRLFCTNTGQRTLLRIELKSDQVAGDVSVLADGKELDSQSETQGLLQGADGIVVGADDLLYICANAANEVQVFSPAGHFVARFRGEGPHRFSSPASIVAYGDRLFVTNTSLQTGRDAKISTFAAV